MFERTVEQLLESYRKDDCLLTAEDYQNAIFVQSACNLSGVVFSFERVMRTLCEEAQRRGEGTEWRNRHPIARLYAEQIIHLSSGKSGDDNFYYSKCHDLCIEKSKAKSKELA